MDRKRQLHRKFVDYYSRSFGFARIITREALASLELRFAETTGTVQQSFKLFPHPETLTNALSIIGFLYLAQTESRERCNIKCYFCSSLIKHEELTIYICLHWNDRISRLYAFKIFYCGRDSNSVVRSPLGRPLQIARRHVQLH